MTRIEVLSGARAPWLLRTVNFFLRRLIGREAVPFNLMGHNPGFLLPYALMGVFVRGKSRLDPRVRMLAIHRVSEINGCSWCLDYAASIALGQLGIATEKMDALANYASSPLFSDTERAAIAFAEAVTNIGAPVSDELFGRLRSFFSEREMVELLAAVCAENFFNRFNIALQVESQGFCEVPSLHRRAA
jgi:AhpD family alkylhydroperoxidase